MGTGNDRKYWLKEDVISVCNPKRIYGLKGDEVLCVNDCGNVLIVEDMKGERFPVLKQLINEEVIEKEDTQVKEVTKIFTKSVTAATKTQKIKPAPLKQKSLFYE